MNRLLLSCLIICLAASHALAAGAGRAFPVSSENYAIKAFQKINPGLEWDKTNFLIDLSGQYANCDAKKGQIRADRKTPGGKDIDVFIDIEPGAEADIDSVDGYIRKVIDRWMNGRQYDSQMKGAKRFGCSVRPSCSGNAVVACVTTEDDMSGKNGGGGNNNGNNGNNNGNSGGGPQEIKKTTPKWPNNNNNQGQNGNTDGNQGDKSIGDSGLTDLQQKALAFTTEQYNIAESSLGSKWDRSHFLEDLSGFETDCSMIGRNDWPFDKIKKAARERNIKITHQYGNAPNKGSTPDALREILSRFKPITSAKQVGCSIIPDCKVSGGSGMEVVIACLYEEA